MRIVPDIGDAPKESAEATSKYRNARSRNALVGPRLALLSRMIDKAPLKWLFSTVEEPLRTIYEAVSSASGMPIGFAYLIIKQQDYDRKDFVSISLVFMGN